MLLFFTILSYIKYTQCIVYIFLVKKHAPHYLFRFLVFSTSFEEICSHKICDYTLKLTPFKLLVLLTASSDRSEKEHEEYFYFLQVRVDVELELELTSMLYKLFCSLYLVFG